MINDRLLALIEMLHHNPNSFAQEIEVASSVIYNIISGRRNKPSCELLERIGKKFSQVNMNWLILNREEPLLQTAIEKDFRLELHDIKNRMEQLEKLAEFRDQYIEILQGKVDKINHIEASKLVKANPGASMPGLSE